MRGGAGRKLITMTFASPVKQAFFMSLLSAATDQDLSEMLKLFLLINDHALPNFTCTQLFLMIV